MPEIFGERIYKLLKSNELPCVVIEQLPNGGANKKLKNEINRAYESSNLYDISIKVIGGSKGQNQKCAAISFVDMDDREEALKIGEKPSQILINDKYYPVKAQDFSAKSQ